MAGCQCCMNSGRWSAQACTCSTFCGPRRALRRSSSSTRLSPVGCSSGSRLVLGVRKACVSRVRKRRYSTGAGKVTRARCSASRRCRWLMSLVGTAVRTTCWPWLAVWRRASNIQRNSMANTPRWRSCSHTCSWRSSRLAPNNKAGALSTWADNSSVASNTSGSTSQGYSSGCKPYAWSSAASTGAPKRRATPPRGKARKSPQRVQPMCASVARWGCAAAKVCSGRSSGVVCLKAGSCKRAIATKDVAPRPYWTSSTGLFDV